MQRDCDIEWRILMGKLRGTLSEEEERIFQAWYSSDIHHQMYMKRLEKLWNIDDEKEFYVDVEAMICAFDKHVTSKKKKTLSYRKWLRVAAIVLPLLGLWGVFHWNMMHAKKEAPVEVKLLPGESLAKLTLADGRVVLLDKISKDELLIDAGNTFIQRRAGQVTYLKNNENSLAQVEYNTLEIPRGGEYVLELCDGTRVWLNSQTRLVYPTSFIGTERVVELEGEAYFQVASDKTNPFIVRIGENTIRVYGTSFNVSAYQDEEQVVTLETGSVGLFVGENEYHLLPGDQASVYEKNGNVTMCKVNANAYCSWRNGTFIFEEERLEVILNRLARWYNVNVFYCNATIKDLHFTGDLSRYDDFMDVLKLIELTTNVEFVVKERNIMVKYK